MNCAYANWMLVIYVPIFRTAVLHGSTTWCKEEIWYIFVFLSWLNPGCKEEIWYISFLAKLIKPRTTYRSHVVAINQWYTTERKENTFTNQLFVQNSIPNYSWKTTQLITSLFSSNGWSSEPYHIQNAFC